MSQGLPEGCLVAWLGDDFTGAAATMEVFAFAGLPSVLFLEPPTVAQRARFPGVRGVGLASIARSRSPEWMTEALPGLFTALEAFAPQLLHYKVCSTLDSAPEVGSIGRAMEIGAELTGARQIPVFVAAPPMRRYQAFGHLFASTAEGVFRLDRHPVMARHPVTPMHEADVARHLSKQTAMPLGCLNLEMLGEPQQISQRLDAEDGPRAWTLDGLGAREESAAGALIWRRRERDRFVVGSQGVQYALLRHWQEEGYLPPPPAPRSLGRTDQMAVVSGSVSPVTAAQIVWARDQGFETIAFDACTACAPDDTLATEETRVSELAAKALSLGRVPLVHSAEGPKDPAVARLRARAGDRLGAANERLGAALGRVLHWLVKEAGVARVVVAGGDTSGHVCKELGLFALTAEAPTIPGAALCKGYAEGAMDGLEVALKGGQMGSPDYFGWIRDGGGPVWTA